MADDTPTLRDYYELRERITKLETQLREMADLQRKALYVLLSAVLIAVLKGAGVI